jgi:protein involved in polysaccharide export with SLBB domain
VHFSGQVNKAGIYKIVTPATVEDLAKASGGWTEFGSPTRLTVIRLERPSSAKVGDPGEPESKVFKYDEIPRKDGKLVLKSGDIVFIPVKRVFGH